MKETSQAEHVLPSSPKLGPATPEITVNECRAMESFIIRIYQRNSAENVIGTVELVGKRCEKSFHNMNELVSILTPMRPRRLGKSKKAAAPVAVKGPQPK